MTFEEWAMKYYDIPLERVQRFFTYDKAAWDAAWAASRKAALEEAREIVSNFELGRNNENQFDFDLLTDRIADAIGERMNT